jgi:ABC-2 type transport system ATP-binding protein
MIEIKSLNKSYGSKKVLTDIDLTFVEGKVYGIVGENGAGKTTLFRCLAGLESYEGEIISSASPLKNNLGLLFAEPFFFSKITGEEYLRLVCNARGVVYKSDESNNIFDLPLKQFASTYSTGMKKKLAITGVLLQENKYFVLDEPFNGVDIQSNMLLTEIILKLKSMNKIVLISSHIFSTLSETCDEIHLLRAGRVVRSAIRSGFDLLEAEMKGAIIKDRVNNLNLK